MVFTIRPFQTRDAADLAALTLAAIRCVGAVRYSPEQVDAWASRHPGPERFVERAAMGHHIFVAADDNDTAAAYSLLEEPAQDQDKSKNRDGGSAHLDMLYCHPDHTRRGLANRLLSVAEDKAREIGAKRLFTEASELARPAFERAGYEVTHRRDFEIEGPSGAISIHNYAMEKTL